MKCGKEWATSEDFDSSNHDRGVGRVSIYGRGEEGGVTAVCSSRFLALHSRDRSIFSRDVAHRHHFPAVVPLARRSSSRCCIHCVIWACFCLIYMASASFPSPLFHLSLSPCLLVLSVFSPLISFRFPFCLVDIVRGFE